MNAGQIVPFLRSVALSGERLSEADFTEITEALARRPALDAERLYEAMPTTLDDWRPFWRREEEADGWTLVISGMDLAEYIIARLAALDAAQEDDGG